MSAVTSDVDRYVCPECGETFKMAMHLGGHRKREHGVIPAKKETRRTTRRRTRVEGSGGRKGGELNRIRRDLTKSVGALTLLPFMANGTADRLADTRVTGIIEDRAGEFADAWVAVAAQNDTVKMWLTTLLAGGVWLNAAGQTLALGYVVAVFSGYSPLHPASFMVLPEMRQFMAETQPQRPNANENGKPEDA